jgi:hypothetical protein
MTIEMKREPGETDAEFEARRAAERMRQVLAAGGRIAISVDELTDEEIKTHLGEQVMLRIIVEILPGGREHLRCELARADLANVSDLSDVSDYAIVASEDVNALAQRGRWEVRGLITKHDRNQSVWSLVAKAAAWAAKEAEKI